MGNGGKAQQDAYVDDAEDTCPLCVEEFDLMDKGFKPCPCGYQICQFCYNNIKSNMNGLCPACRRPYDDKTVERKVVSVEEYKADVAAQARKKAAARQKEAERKQVETLKNKHLAGLRVLQKNLVYVNGMDVSGDAQALETLRGQNHFGQYGEIIKIVASKAKEGYAGHQSTGVYVTFARKEDAETCIAAVDGTLYDGNRVLRAQYGTTKYCSSFLRNERCTNRNCMFLHETGDDNDSFSRQDLSSFNAASSQTSMPTSLTDNARVTYQSSNHTASPRPTAAVRAEAMSRSDSGSMDGPALPTTATWAKNPQIESSRRSSLAPARATPSPKPVSAKPVQPVTEPKDESKSKGKKPVTTKKTANAPPQEPAPKPKLDSSDSRTAWEREINSLSKLDLTSKFDRSMFDEETLRRIDTAPRLFDLAGGVLRSIRNQEREKELAEKLANPAQPPDLTAEEAQFASGSGQLGGEPEHGDDLSTQRGSRGQTPFANFTDAQAFTRQAGIADDFADLTLGPRSLTPQQQRNLSAFRSETSNPDATGGPLRGSAGNHHQSQPSNPFQSQNQQMNALRHGRQQSRYNFGTESGDAKSSGNAQSANQFTSGDSRMFGPTQPNLQSSVFSGVQGPPPGLKASGTPSISGGGMFVQGHGFANAMGGASGFNKTKEETTRDLPGGRSGAGGNIDFSDPSIFSTRLQLPAGNYTGPQAQDMPNFNELNNTIPILPTTKAIDNLSKSDKPSTPLGLGPKEFPPLAPKVKPVITASSRGATVTPAASRPGSSTIAPSSNGELTVTAPVVSGSSKEELPNADAPKSGKVEAILPSGSSSAAPVKAVESITVPVQNVDEESVASTIKPVDANLKDETVTPSTAAIAKQSAEPDEKAAALPSESKSQNDPKTDGVKQQVTSVQSATLNTPASAQALAGKISTIQSSTSATEPVGELSTSQAPATTSSATFNSNIVANTSANTSSIASANTGSTPHKDVPESRIPSTQNDNIAADSKASQPSSVPQPPPLTRAPRTLRLITTIKAEASVAASAPASADTASMTNETPSMGLASGSTTRQPNSPLDDLMSENISLTSAAPTRPGSPSLSSRVHAGPSTVKSKNQIKKERQARAKELEEKAKPEEAATPEEPSQAPILARKKKAKKPARSTPVSQAPSRTTSATVKPAEEPMEESKPETPAEEPVPELLPEITPVVEEPPEELPKPQSPRLLPADSILQDLKSTEILSADTIWNFIKPHYLNTKHENIDSTYTFTYSNPLTLDEEDLEILDSGDTLTHNVNPGEYAVVLPDRSVLRHYHQTEACRYNELRLTLQRDTPVLFNAEQHPMEPWLNLTSNDNISGMQIAPAAQPYHQPTSPLNPDTPEPLLAEYQSLLLAQQHHDPPNSSPNGGKELSYSSIYPPRTAAENEEIEARMALYSIEESEQTARASEELLQQARRETEALEKRLKVCERKNRRILAGVLGGDTK